MGVPQRLQAGLIVCNYSAQIVRRDTPLLPEEGRTRHKADAAKPPLKERTGWSLTSHISECVLNMACERPPRLRRFGGFATFSYWRSHPSSGRRGVSRPNQSTK